MDKVSCVMWVTVFSGCCFKLCCRVTFFLWSRGYTMLLGVIGFSLSEGGWCAARGWRCTFNGKGGEVVAQCATVTVLFACGFFVGVEVQVAR